MFLRNAWYVAALGHEVGRTPLRRHILGEPVALYRTEDGRPIALQDRCIHRRLPLSAGKLIGDDIQCPYHGFTYDPTGKCIKIPAQTHIPARARVRSYPLVERWTWLWIWTGEPEKADETLIPEFKWLDLPGWTPTGELLNVKANYQLLVDNLLDLSHETYVHAGTIGNAAVAEAPITTREGDGIVHVERVMKDVPPPPLFARVLKSEAPIDRYQFISFLPPCYVRIDARGVPAGSNTSEGGLRWWVLNALTPETERTTNYFWSLSRNFAQDDAELTKMLHGAVVRTFNEDVEILEMQQRANENDRASERTVDVGIDGGTVLARKMVDELIRAETAGAAS